jgi:hypothetical protein
MTIIFHSFSRATIFEFTLHHLGGYQVGAVLHTGKYTGRDLNLRNEAGPRWDIVKAPSFLWNHWTLLEPSEPPFSLSLSQGGRVLPTYLPYSFFRAQFIKMINKGLTSRNGKAFSSHSFWPPLWIPLPRGGLIRDLLFGFLVYFVLCLCHIDGNKIYGCYFWYLTKVPPQCSSV